MNKIPLSIPNLSGNEKKYLNQCVDTNFVSSVGSFVSDFEEKLAKFLDVKHAIAVVNGTAALHLSLVGFDIGKGDEVLVPNLTFIAPLNAVSYTGATPILIDCELDTLGICPQKIEEYIEENAQLEDGVLRNKKTGHIIKAIMPVHIFGFGCKMDELQRIAKKYSLKVIEDASEALGSQEGGKFFGTYGDLGCFSFNGNKIITSGGGGMIVTDNTEMAKKLKHLSTTAKINGLYFEHDEIGYNYRMVNVLAAIGLAQLEQIEGFMEVKLKNALLYKEKTRNLRGFSYFWPENNQKPNHWFYSIVLDDEIAEERDKVIDYLQENGVDCRPIWKLMNELSMFKKLPHGDLSQSKYISEKIINVPCSTNLKEDEIIKVVDKLSEAIAFLKDGK